MIASLCWVPVNAHAPFKGGTIFSHHYVFVWAGKNHSKMQRVEADLFENRGKISPFSDKNRYLWTGP